LKWKKPGGRAGLFRLAGTYAWPFISLPLWGGIIFVATFISHPLLVRT
jgi:hypothetical protein